VRFTLPLAPRASITKEALNERLAQINYRGRYTDIPAALERALSELKQNGRPQVRKSIVLLTDGVIDTGTVRNDLDGARWIREDLAADAIRQGLRFYAVAVGDKTDFKLLHSLVQKTGGEYYRAEGRDELARVLARIGVSLAASQGQHAGESSRATVDAARHLDSQARVTAEAQTVEAPKDVPAPDTAIEAAVPANARDKTVEVQTGRRAQDYPLSAQSEDPRGQVGSHSPVESSAVDRWWLWGPWLAGISVLLILILLLLLRREKDSIVSTAEQVFSAHRADTKPVAFLYDLRDETRQTRHPLTMRPTLIGRTAPAPGEHADQLLIDRPEVSCRHAIVEYKTLAYWIADQGSTNGTFLNGRRITGKVRLKNGDRIRFHNLEFEFDWPDMDVAAAKTRIVTAQDLGADQQGRSDGAPVSPRSLAEAERSSGRPEAGALQAGDPQKGGDAPVDQRAEDKPAPPKPFDVSVTLPSAREVKRALNDYFEE
jgi:hypothetical protein